MVGDHPPPDNEVYCVCRVRARGQRFDGAFLIWMFSMLIIHTTGPFLSSEDWGILLGGCGTRLPGFLCWCHDCPPMHVRLFLFAASVHVQLQRGWALFRFSRTSQGSSSWSCPLGRWFCICICQLLCNWLAASEVLHNVTVGVCTRLGLDNVSEGLLSGVLGSIQQGGLVHFMHSPQLFAVHFCVVETHFLDMPHVGYFSCVQDVCYSVQSLYVGCSGPPAIPQAHVLGRDYHLTVLCQQVFDLVHA